MRISKLVPKSGGKVKYYFNPIVLLLVGIFNVTDQILSNKDMVSDLYMTLPFFIVAILLLYSRTNKITKTIIFTCIGIAYEMGVPDTSYLGASTFFILAFIQYPNLKTGVLFSSLTILSIIIKSTLINGNPFDVTTAIVAFMFIYVNVYNTWVEYKLKVADLQRQLKKKNKQEPITRNIDVINIKEEEKAIIKLYCNGMDYENISKFLGLNVVPKTIRKRITMIKKEYNIKSDAHFAHWAFSKV